jgi:NAD dependent epimerase/dehydratase family enzyme
MRIMIAGASGLVGTSVVRLLADRHPVLIGRREAPWAGQQLVGPPTEWPSQIARHPVDAAICTLGTTIRIAG